MPTISSAYSVVRFWEKYYILDSYKINMMAKGIVRRDWDYVVIDILLLKK